MSLQLSRKMLCWKPKMAATASAAEISAMGLTPLKNKSTYSVERSDIHPELHWGEDKHLRKQKNTKTWFAPEQRLDPQGFNADVMHEAMVVGVERGALEKYKKSQHRAMQTQGGRGMKGSEFIAQDATRAMMPGSFQYEARKKRIHEDWEDCKWDDRYFALRRTMEFTNPRFTFFMYNRICDRALVHDYHFPIEIIIQKNTCTVYLTTTYVQGVSALDFELINFIDKERSLMKRDDWTPVVTRTSEKFKSFKHVTPDRVLVTETDFPTSANNFINELSCSWEYCEELKVFSTSVALRSWSRAMDVTNTVLETCEAVRQYPNKICISVGNLNNIEISDTPEGRYVITVIDNHISSHTSYLNNVWAPTGGVSGAPEDSVDPFEKQTSHLADLSHRPQGYFLKNPLGKGTGPIRKVTFEQPKDIDQSVRHRSWSEPKGNQSQSQPTTSESPKRRSACSTNATKRIDLTRNVSFVEMLRDQIQGDERMKNSPNLE